MLKKIKISSTDYIDYVIRTGSKKVTKVKSIFNRPEYHPAFDYYKQLREVIIQVLKAKGDEKKILDFIENAAHPNKRDHYKSVTKGFFRFLKKYEFEPLPDQKGEWNYKSLIISVNPEISLQIGESKFFIKFYFKDQALLPSEAESVLNLMHQTLANGLHKGYQCAVLDLRKGKLHKLKNPDQLLNDLLEGEAESFIKIWERLVKESA